MCRQITIFVFSLAKMFSSKKKDQNYSTSQSNSTKNINKASMNQTIELVTHLKKHPQLQSKMDTYIALTIHELESLITLCLEHDEISMEIQSTVIQLLKKQSFIVALTFNHEKFQPENIFRFLRLKNVTHQKLMFFQDLMLPYAKKFSKHFIKIIQQSKFISQSLCNFIYHKSIFKIIYTCVFCLENENISDCMITIQNMIDCLQKSPFAFGPEICKMSEGQMTSNKMGEGQVGSNKMLEGLNDYGQLSYNMYQFFKDLTSNFSSVEIKMVMPMIVHFNESYIDRILETVSRLQDEEDYNQYCQGFILIIYSLLKLFQTIKFADQSLSPDDLQIRTHLKDQLLTTIRHIATKIPIFLRYLQSNPIKNLHFSSGEILIPVGMKNYRVLTVIQNILLINEIENLEIKFSDFDLIEAVEVFLGRHKWNNMCHLVIVNIVNLIMGQDYANFKKRHILFEQNLACGLFGRVISSFRNKKYIFLSTTKMSNQGNRHVLFELCKCMINEMQNSNDLNYVMERFPYWKTFIEKDLRQYEETLEYSRYFNSQIVEKKINLQSSLTGYETPAELSYGHKPLESIGEILNHLEEQKKWSPKQNKQPKYRKQSIIQNGFMGDMDSVVLRQK